MNAPGRGNGVVSAITPNSEPRSGVEHTPRYRTRRQCKARCRAASRFGTCHHGAAKQPRKDEGIGAQTGKHAKGTVRRR